MMGKTTAAAALLVAARVLSPVGTEEHWHDPSPHRVHFVTVEKDLHWRCSTGADRGGRMGAWGNAVIFRVAPS